MARRRSGHAQWAVGVFLGCLLAGSQVLADTMRGVLRSADLRGHRIVVTDPDGDDNPFATTPTTRVVLNGRPASLADLRPGDQVAVTFREDPEGRATALTVVATRSAK